MSRPGRATPILAACLLTLSAASLRGQTGEITLTASRVTWEVAPGQTVDAYAYNGTVPGPELRFRTGDPVRVTLLNDLPEPTTIHWHGIAVPSGMDGVPGISAPEVAPGGRFTYQFTAPAPGTYLVSPPLQQRGADRARALRPSHRRSGRRTCRGLSKRVLARHRRNRHGRPHDDASRPRHGRGHGRRHGHRHGIRHGRIRDRRDGRRPLDQW